MKINENTRIYGASVILVPYRRLHVPKYHDWMKEEELLKLTASEPLSLEEEYEMQKNWHLDENKCTFIILDKETFLQTNDEVAAMIGDTNLFFSNRDANLAEAEIMIAEKSYRGKKRGWEAILIMLKYGCDYLKVQNYEVKIGFRNKQSIYMFQKIGFTEVSRSEVFEEITMQIQVTGDWVEWLCNETKHTKQETE